MNTSNQPLHSNDCSTRTNPTPTPACQLKAFQANNKDCTLPLEPQLALQRHTPGLPDTLGTRLCLQC
jgi:hypothetical protein